MSPSPPADPLIPQPRPAWREHVDLGVAVFCAAFLAFGAICLLWALDLQAPRVTLLGSGEGELAVLVSAGDARLLIATGDDPASLTTALERARHPTTRRLDLLLVGASERDLRGALPLFADAGTRLVGILGPRPASGLAGALPASSTSLTAPTRFALTEDVTVDIEILPRADGDPPAWRAMVRDGATSVLVISEAGAAESIDLTEPVAALVVATGRDPLAAWRRVGAPLLAFPEGAISGDAVRAAAASGAAPRWTIRVFPAEAIRLGLDDAGVAVPASLLQPLASPVSGGRRPLPAGRRRTRPAPPPAGSDRRGDRRR